MDRHNRRRSRIVGAIAATLLYGTALVFASSLSGTAAAEADAPRTPAAATGPAVVASSPMPADDPLATITIVGIGLGAAGLWRMRRWQLKRLVNRRPATVPARLQPVPERVTTIG